MGEWEAFFVFHSPMPWDASVSHTAGAGGL
jgi:hypothetical protein